MEKDDLSVYNREFVLLAERFNFKPSTAMSARYWAFLCERMTTPQFIKACATLYATARFFPAPLEFVEAVTGKADDNARRCWAAIMTAVKGASQPTLDAIGALAFRELGGMGYVNSLDWGGLRWAEKDFVALYRLEWQVRHLDALPAAQKNILEIEADDDN